MYENETEVKHKGQKVTLSLYYFVIGKSFIMIIDQSIYYIKQPTNQCQYII